MITSELIKAIEDAYYSRFPKSKIFVKFSTNLYRSISIRCFLAGDKIENPSHYWDNDILHVSFMISGENFKEFSRDTTLECQLDSISLENSHKSYRIKPDSSYMVYGRRKLSFRKVQGNPEKIIQSLSKFFDKLKESLLDDLTNDNIHNSHLEIVKNKIF